MSHGNTTRYKANLLNSIWFILKRIYGIVRGLHRDSYLIGVSRKGLDYNNQIRARNVFFPIYTFVKSMDKEFVREAVEDRRRS